MYDNEMSHEDIVGIATRLCQGGFHSELSFQNKNNRDAVAREAAARGARIKKSSTPNQIIDPRYTMEGAHLPDMGLANHTIYTNLYHLTRTL